MKAIWKGQVIAESNETRVVEGNHYFPADSLRKEYIQNSDKQTVCHWKGTASYYDLKVDGSVNKDAAWYYPSPRELAEGIKDYVAFWKGVEVTK